jgi:HD superfamily phosphohydrolase
MRIWDAVYGAFDLPSFLEELIMSPEFRRLSEVRLININSASLASLADVRRYSHTLGALRLALENSLPTLGAAEHRAFLAAMIVHDAGTPAFAHLFEYFLMDKFDWDHESVLPLLLSGKHHPDEQNHQIYSSQVPQFRKICKESKIDFDIVVDILSGTHASSKLIFGSVDFDNIDNVARMNWMLGHRFDVNELLSLARNIGVASDGTFLLPMAQKPALDLWLRLRRQAYEVLVFDGPTVAGQAVLSRAISEALKDHTLSDFDWHYTDSELIRIIRGNSAKAKALLDRDFFGTLPHLSMIVQITDDQHPCWGIVRDELASLVECFLVEQFDERRAYGYVLRDRGTFEKRISAVDPGSGLEWELGKRSNSLVIYGFGVKQLKMKPEIIGGKFLQWLVHRI